MNHNQLGRNEIVTLREAVVESRRHDRADELIHLLTVAVQYLEHPDVDAMCFALPASAVAARIRQALREHDECEHC